MIDKEAERRKSYDYTLKILTMFREDTVYPTTALTALVAVQASICETLGLDEEQAVQMLRAAMKTLKEGAHIEH